MTLAELEVLKCQSSIVKIRRECLFLADCCVCNWVVSSRAASLCCQLKADRPFSAQPHTPSCANELLNGCQSRARRMMGGVHIFRSLMIISSSRQRICSSPLQCHRRKFQRQLYLCVLLFPLRALLEPAVFLLWLGALYLGLVSLFP